MRLLLDTHVALWEITDSTRLAEAVRQRLRSEENSIFVSVISLWEIAIKFARPRGRPDDMPISSQAALEFFVGAGYEILDVTAEHALAVERLPLLHRDPFDRMLIAQARSEPLRLLTADATVAGYGDGVELL
jgi:PIN domain nuclease of toxin-antitoxin system